MSLMMANRGLIRKPMQDVGPLVLVHDDVPYVNNVGPNVSFIYNNKLLYINYIDGGMFELNSGTFQQVGTEKVTCVCPEIHDGKIFLNTESALAVYDGNAYTEEMTGYSAIGGACGWKYSPYYNACFCGIYSDENGPVIWKRRQNDGGYAIVDFGSVYDVYFEVDNDVLLYGNGIDRTEIYKYNPAPATVYNLGYDGISPCMFNGRMYIGDLNNDKVYSYSTYDLQDEQTLFDFGVGIIYRLQVVNGLMLIMGSDAIYKYDGVSVSKIADYDYPAAGNFFQQGSEIYIPCSTNKIYKLILS
jgi:hypothetical protein